ncbi:MAG: hypothetical protein ACTHKQ_24890 [Mesorhizobium sp.]
MQVIEFQSATADREAVIELLEDALEKARAGQAVNAAIVLAIRDEDGPQFWHGYYGERAYATLLAGVSALEFDLHYRRYNPEA